MLGVQRGDRAAASSRATRAPPRESVGGDPRALAVRLRGRPRHRDARRREGASRCPRCSSYGSVIFRELRGGLRVPARRAARGRGAGEHPADGQPPVPVRPGAQAARDRARGAEEPAREVLRDALTRLRPSTAWSACTLALRGHARRGRGAGARGLPRSPRATAACRAGAENGQRGYALTFAIAYIRDFMMNHHVLAESFETVGAVDRSASR